MGMITGTYSDWAMHRAQRQAFSQDGVRDAGNYRIAVATAIPALFLAYVKLLWPMIYMSSAPTADVAFGLVSVAEPDFVLNKIFFPLSFVLAFALYAAERPRWSKELLLCGAVAAALLGYFLVSTLWAILPARTLTQSALLIMIMSTVALSSHLSDGPDRVFRLIFWVIAAATLANVLALFLREPTVIGHRGIYQHKNGLGAFGAVALFFALYGTLQSKRWMRMLGLLLIPMALAILYLSQSKTSLGLGIVTPALAFAFWVMVRLTGISFLLGLGVSLVAAAGVIMTASIQGLTIGDISTLIAGEPTFTGRTNIWDFVLHHIQQKPLIGHGYRSFWNIGDASPAIQGPVGFIQVAPHGHNGYLDLVLENGLIGLILFGFLLVVAFWRLGHLDAYAPDAAFLGLCILIFSILLNLTETTWLSAMDTDTMILFIILFAAPSPSFRRRRP